MTVTLTEVHRLRQAQIADATVAEVRSVFPILNANDLASSFPKWLRVIEPIVDTARRASTQLAADYLTTVRMTELGTSFTPVLPAPLETDVLETSLFITGPAKIRRQLANKIPLVKVMSDADASTAAAAMRHSINAGRDTIVDTVRADPHAVGWARATSGSCCAFCALLASRGPVYRTEGTVSFHAHDRCLCSAQPVYSDRADWPSHSQRFRQIYQESTAGLSGSDAINAFRKALAGG